MPARLVRVVLVEDNPADAELEVRELRRAGLQLEHRVVDSEDSFRGALRDFSPQIILSDFSMPGFDGMAALALSRELAPQTPFLFVSGTLGEEYAIRALRNGATDYVLKTNLVRLPAAVERALEDAERRAQQRRVEAELNTTRERLEAIFTSLPDVLWSVDAATEQVLYASPAANEIYGRAPEEFLQNPRLWLEVIHPEDRARVGDTWQKFLKGQSYDLEYRVVQPDGSVRWVHDRARLVHAQSGTPQRVDGLVRDITTQVVHRQRIARLSRIRDLMAELNAAIVRIRDRQELFEAFCRIAVARGGFYSARIVEHDPMSRKLRLAGVTDAANDEMHALVAAYNEDPGGAQSLVAETLRTAAAVIANNATDDKRATLRGWYEEQGIHSVACLPYRVEGTVAGVIVLNARERNYFDQEEVALVAELAGNLGFALEVLAKQDRIAYLAHHDALTGLPNRVLLDERLRDSVQAAGAAGRPLTLVVFDLERFKAINDVLGPEVGDRVLRALAERLKDARGGIANIARLSGNVFASILDESAEDLERRLERDTKRFFDRPFELGDHEIRLSAKLGVASFPKDGTDAATLFRNAEAALRHAKQAGEPYVFYAPQINARASEQRELEHRLRLAVEHGELFLHYQPKVDLTTKRIVGLEALMRWQTPEGLVSPAKFVPILEQTGLILEAGRQAIAAARAAYRRWKERGLEAPRIAVNVSALQLRRRDFVQDVLAALGSDARDGGGVDLEITESLLMTDVEESIRKLSELRERGLCVALDDFGTGYSSLAYLSRLPLDTLKIDRGFVRGMAENASDTTLVSTIISLAQALKLKVVAEGVETEQQAQLLRLLRCDQA